MAASEAELTPEEAGNAHRVMGLGARIMLAWHDGDRAKAMALVGPDPGDAVMALASMVWGVMAREYGPEGAHEQLVGAAILADLHGMDEGQG